MYRKRVKDNSFVYIAIAILCLIIFFVGFSIMNIIIIEKNTVDYNNKDEVVTVIKNLDTQVTELKTKSDNNPSILNNTDLGNFFLKVISNCNTSMKIQYKNVISNNSKVGVLKKFKQKLLSSIKPKTYLKTQLPVIFNIVDTSTIIYDNNTSFKKSNIVDEASLLDDYKDQDIYNNSSKEEKSSLVNDLVFINPYSEQEDLTAFVRSKEINIEELKSVMEVPDSIRVNEKKPYILIYHTHATEVYFEIKKDNFHSRDREYSVIKVGDILSKELIKKGHTVKHIDIYHDIPSFSKSYAKSLATVKREMKKQNNIKVLLDIHRDGIPTEASYFDDAKKQSKINIGGTSVATFRFVIGPENPNKKEIIKFAKYIKVISDCMYPGLCKGIVVKPYGKYNQFLSDYSALLEVGSNLNTIDEAQKCAKLIANVLDKAINGLK